MADIFGQSLCDQFIGFEILSLGEHSSSKLRKEIVQIFLPISLIVS
jgi:hypothetical protein